MKSMVQFKLTVMAASHQALPLAAIRPDPVCSERDCLRSGWNAGTLRHGPQNPTPNRSRTPAKPCNQCPCPAYRPIPNKWPPAGQPQSSLAAKVSGLSQRRARSEGKGWPFGWLWDCFLCIVCPFICIIVQPCFLAPLIAPALLLSCTLLLLACNPPSFPLFPLVPSLLDLRPQRPSYK